MALSTYAASAQAQQGTTGDVVAPRQDVAPPVPYPEGAVGDEQVVLELEIDQAGNVAKVTTRAGRQPFADAARAGVLNWRFFPATRGGLTVRARILVEIRFTQPQKPIEALPNEPAGEGPIQEIHVLGERRQEIGTTYIPREDARRIPGTFTDPFRVTEVMPGVAPIVSGIPYFFVRGAPPGNVGYLIDGIRVPLLFHVGAGPSVIASALVDRVDFLPSAYPARLGRFAGAIVAGETMPLSSVARGELQARVFDSGGMVEVPFAEGRGSVLVGGRYSYMGPVLSVVAPDYRVDYWDYQARLGYRWNATDSISVFAFGASDELENKELGRTLFDTQFHRLDLRWDHQSANNRTRAGITFALDDVGTEDRDALDEESTKLETRGARLRLETAEQLSRSVVLRAGLEYELERIANEEDFVAGTTSTYPARTDLMGVAYIDAVLKPIRAVELVPGMRFDTGVWRRDTYFFLEPRLASRVRLGGGAAWTSTFGRVHQLPTQSVRIPGRTLVGLETTVQEAWQTAEGLELALPWSMLAKLSLFYSRISADDSQFGRNFGVEAFLRRDFSEGLGGFLSYTLSRTELTRGRETFPSEFDRTHLVSAALGYDFGAGFRLGGRAYYASGQRYSVGCGTDEGTIGEVPGGLPCSTGRLPDFFRMDVRFEKRWTFASAAWIALAFEWFNAGVAREASDIEVVNGGLRPRYESALTVPSLGLEAGF